MGKGSIDDRVGKFDANRPAIKLETGEVLTEGQLWALKEDPRYWRAGSIDRDYQWWVERLFTETYDRPAGSSGRRR